MKKENQEEAAVIPLEICFLISVLILEVEDLTEMMVKGGLKQFKFRSILISSSYITEKSLKCSIFATFCVKTGRIV